MCFSSWCKPSKTKHWTQEVVDDIELITNQTVYAIGKFNKVAKSQCHKHFATEEDLAREEECKNLQTVYDIVKADHQHLIQEARKTLKKNSLIIDSLAKEVEEQGEINKQQQLEWNNLAKIYGELRELYQDGLDQIKDCRKRIVEEKRNMFGDGDNSMNLDAIKRLLKRLLERLPWKKILALIALYQLPAPVGTITSVIDAACIILQLCYPTYLRTNASGHVKGLEKGLKRFEMEWTAVLCNVKTTHASMLN